jgi:YegS/Rv2252/BmrU family lipid kinase
MDVQLTTGPGDATRLAGEAVRGGIERVIVMGGDGTLSECANGFFVDGANVGAGVELGMIPVGTGRDFVRALWTRTDVEYAIDRVLTGTLCTVDVGQLTALGDDGVARARMFMNAASVGLGGLVAARVERSPMLKRVLGPGVFAAATLLELPRHRATMMRISADGQPGDERPIALIVIANGRFFGGGMQIAPGARVDDGQFDVITAHAMAPHELAGLLLSVYSGSHLAHPKVTHSRVSRLTVTATSSQAWIEADGEPMGRLPASFSLVPGAILMRA